MCSVCVCVFVVFFLQPRDRARSRLGNGWHIRRKRLYRIIRKHWQNFFISIKIEENLRQLSRERELYVFILFNVLLVVAIVAVVHVSFFVFLRALSLCPCVTFFACLERSRIRNRIYIGFKICTRKGEWREEKQKTRTNTSELNKEEEVFLLFFFIAFRLTIHVQTCYPVAIVALPLFSTNPLVILTILSLFRFFSHSFFSFLFCCCCCCCSVQFCSFFFGRRLGLLRLYYTGQSPYSLSFFDFNNMFACVCWFMRNFLSNSCSFSILLGIFKWSLRVHSIPFYSFFILYLSFILGKTGKKKCHPLLCFEN